MYNKEKYIHKNASEELKAKVLKGNTTVDFAYITTKNMERDYLITILNKSSSSQGIKGGQAKLAKRVGITNNPGENTPPIQERTSRTF